MIDLYVQPPGAHRWCKLDPERSTMDSYVTSCGARIDASEILFLALHTPGRKCSACCPPSNGDIFAGQITVVSKTKSDLARIDMMSVADPAEIPSDYDEYDVIPGEHTEPTVLVDPELELGDDTYAALREWDGP